jgi:hypothetical protein
VSRDGRAPRDRRACCSTALWPGVTHARTVQFTNHGPVVLNVIAGPRPGGLTTLEPLLSNDSVLGRETVSSMQRRVIGRRHRRGQRRLLAVRQRAGQRDLHATRRPRCRAERQTVERRRADGRTLDVRKIGLRATWAGHGRPSARRAQRSTNSRRRRRLHRGYGTANAVRPGSTAAVLFPFRS